MKFIECDSEQDIPRTADFLPVRASDTEDAEIQFRWLFEGEPIACYHYTDERGEIWAFEVEK